jgi:hypothetical protein
VITQSNKISWAIVYVSSEQKSSILETYMWVNIVVYILAKPIIAPWLVYHSLWWYIESGSKLSYCIVGNFIKFCWH